MAEIQKFEHFEHCGCGMTKYELTLEGNKGTFREYSHWMGGDNVDKTRTGYLVVQDSKGTLTMEDGQTFQLEFLTQPQKSKATAGISGIQMGNGPGWSKLVDLVLTTSKKDKTKKYELQAIHPKGCHFALGPKGPLYKPSVDYSSIFGHHFGEKMYHLLFAYSNPCIASWELEGKITEIFATGKKLKVDTVYLDGEFNAFLTKPEDPKINTLLEQFPQLERQKLRQFVRQANKEKKQEKPAKAAKELFAYLKPVCL